MSNMGQYIFEQQIDDPDKGIDLSGFAEDEAYLQWSKEYDQEGNHEC